MASGSAIAPSLLQPPPHVSTVREQDVHHRPFLTRTYSHNYKLSISPCGKTVVGEAGMAKTLVTVSNPTSDPGLGGVAFKIKTTKPKRYLVRPNQSILMAGERREVAILMSPEKQAEARQEHGQVVMDKFQVVYLPLNKAVCDSFEKSGDVKEQVGQLERLWQLADKRAVCKLTFEVEIALQEETSTQDLRNTPSTSWAEKNGKPSSAPSSVGELHSPGSVMHFSLTSNQMTEYRQRYDDLVTFTVALTNERDLLINALDSVKLQLRRELSSHADVGKLGPEDAVNYELLNLHKRRRASSFSPVSIIPGIASHAHKSPSALDARHEKCNLYCSSSSSSSMAERGKVSRKMLLVLLLVAIFLGHKVRENFGLWWWFF